MLLVMVAFILFKNKLTWVLCLHYSCCGAGTAADTEYTTRLISSQLELHRLNSGRIPRVCTANRMLKQMLFRSLITSNSSLSCFEPFTEFTLYLWDSRAFMNHHKPDYNNIVFYYSVHLNGLRGCQICFPCSSHVFIVHSPLLEFGIDNVKNNVLLQSLP